MLSSTIYKYGLFQVVYLFEVLFIRLMNSFLFKLNFIMCVSGTQNSNSFSSLSCKHQTTCHNNLQTHRTTSEEPCTLVMQSQTAPTTAPVQTLSTIPLLIQEQQNKPELAAQTTYIVTPMSQLVQTPYPAAHTITVTPLTNYAFTTM